MISDIYIKNRPSKDKLLLEGLLVLDLSQ